MEITRIFFQFECGEDDMFYNCWNYLDSLWATAYMTWYSDGVCPPELMLEIIKQ